MHGGRGPLRCFDKVIATKAAMTSVTWQLRTNVGSGGQAGEMKVWRFQGLLECSNDSTTEGTMIHRYELRFLGRSGSCFQAIERDFFSNFLDAWGDFLSTEK